MSRDGPEVLSDTNESIYTACRYVVSVSHKGEGLYGNLKLALEQCLRDLAKELVEAKAEGPIHWIGIFVKACEWFERKTVSNGDGSDLQSSSVHLLGAFAITLNLSGSSICPEQW